MHQAHELAQNDKEHSAKDNVRKCLVTGQMLPREELIRFALDSEDRVTPDLQRNLPGRGLWVSADPDCLREAVAKNLFSRAAKKTVKTSPDLPQQVAQLMRKRCLDYLGLARRSGDMVLGQPQVEAALRAGKLTILFMADDAGTELKSQTADSFNFFTRNELGAALGHDQLVYLGITRSDFASHLLPMLRQMQKLLPLLSLTPTLQTEVQKP